MSAGLVAAVCVSPRKGTKRAVDEAALRQGHGIEGDVHAGAWHRQVSLLDEADVDGMRAGGLDLEAGDFGENLLLRGVDLASLGIGSRLAVGGAELEVTQVGKVCHSRCAIYAAAGDCIMPRAGVFARVEAAGRVRPGDPARVTARVARETVQAAVLTVSDRCAAGTAEDTAGPGVAELLAAALDAHLAWHGVVADDAEAVAGTLRDLADRGLDLVLTVGGTGLAPRDVTPEATRAVLDREAPGLAEAMRAASAAVTPRAWLSRAVAGVRRHTLIVNLPGSRTAARENLEALLPVLPHAVEQLRGGSGHAGAEAGRHAPAALRRSS